MYAVCDRIENGTAVLVFDDEITLNIPISELNVLVGADVCERDVLLAVRDGNCAYGIKSASLDTDERDRRLADARARLLRLASKSKKN